jgi:hypothetical protein
VKRQPLVWELASIPAIRCACGSDQCMTFDPGEPPEISESSDVMVSRGRPVIGWCLPCFLATISSRTLPHQPA